MTSEKAKVVIALPTINCSAYIRSSLRRLAQEIDLVREKFQADLLICLNGTQDGGLSIREIEAFHAERPDLNMKLLVVEGKGKNRAVNHLVDYAKSRGYEIIHLTDDDVYFEEGSILTNLREIIRQRNHIKAPLLVGSHFLGISKSFSEFRKKEGNWWKALRPWFWHNVFITPFRDQSDRPRFCSGQSYCFYVADLPVLPPDETGITDDVYLGHYFSYAGEDWFKRTRISPVIKPSESVVRFHIPTDRREWEGQQIRTCIGILAGFDFFGDKREYLEDFHQWAYGYNRNCLKPERFTSLSQRFFFAIHYQMATRVLNKAKKIMESRAAVPWAAAATTKEPTAG